MLRKGFMMRLKTMHVFAWILILIFISPSCRQQETSQPLIPAIVTPTVSEPVLNTSEPECSADDRDPNEVIRSILEIRIEDDIVYLLLDDLSLWAWSSHFSETETAPATLESTQMKPFVHVLDQVKKLVRHGAIRSDDTLWMWSPEQFEPVHVLSDIKDFKDNLFIKTDDSLWAFGSRYFYLGDGVECSIDNPETLTIDDAVRIMDGVRHIVSGGMYSAVVTEDDRLMRWGTPINMDEADYFVRQSAMGQLGATRPVHTLSNVRNAVFSSLQYDPSLVVQLANGLVLQAGGIRQLIANPADSPVDPRFPSFIPPVSKRFHDVQTTSGMALYLLQEDGRLLVSPGLDSSVEPLPFSINMEGQLTDYYEIDQDVEMFAACQNLLIVLKSDGILYAAGIAPFDPQDPYSYTLRKTLTPAFLSVHLSASEFPEPDQTEPDHLLSDQSDFYELDYWYDDVMEMFGLQLFDATIFALVFKLDDREVAVPVIGPYHPEGAFIYNTGFEPDDYFNRPDYLYDVFSGVPILERSSNLPYYQSLQLTPFLSGDFKFIEVYSLDALLKQYLYLDVDMSAVKTVRDLRLLYEKYVPNEKLLIVDDTVRFISDKTYVETFQTMDTGESKIRFVNSFTTAWEDDVVAGDDRIYNLEDKSVFDLITGQYIGMARYMDGRLEFDFYHSLRRKKPAQMIPFFEYFPDLKGTTIISALELEQLYQQRIPLEYQVELEPFESPAE